MTIAQKKEQMSKIVARLKTVYPDAFKDIDAHSELKGHHTFETARESFDFAAQALKNLLTSLGFKEGENREWKR